MLVRIVITNRLGVTEVDGNVIVCFHLLQDRGRRERRGKVKKPPDLHAVRALKDACGRPRSPSGNQLQRGEGIGKDLGRGWPQC